MGQSVFAGLADVTALLGQWQRCSPQQEEQLVRVLYDALYAIAAHHDGMITDDDPLLSPTVLLNEAYTTLKAQAGVCRSRREFHGLCVKVMRLTLLNYRHRQPPKALALDELTTLMAPADDNAQLLALDRAIASLEALYPRSGEILCLHYYAGLVQKEIAELLNMSLRSVERELQFARAWLATRLDGVSA